MGWWRRDRRDGGKDDPRDWQDLADAWEDPDRAGADPPTVRREPGPETRAPWWRRARRKAAPEEEWDEDDWDEDEWDEEDWDEEDWDEDEWDGDGDEDDRHDEHDRPRGWQDPDPRPRRESFGRWLILLPVRVLLLPLRLVLWFTVLCLAWVAAYAWVDPPVWTHLLAEEDRLGQVVSFPRDLDDISPHLVRAVIAAEDARFCEHWGIDLDATRAALEETLEGERVIGGSTITQQTAKNVFLWHDRSWLRKGLEAGFAVAMEWIWGKRRIVEVYLNVAEFDEGTFGAEAAARGYFGKRAADLTLEEAALLAAVLPDPRNRSAARPGELTRARARAIADGARTLQRQGRDGCVLD